MKQTSPVLVLTMINGPCTKKLTAPELANCLLDPSAAKAVPGHMSSFFGEVPPSLQVGFAGMFNISEVQLSAAAKTFALYSGESYPLAA